MKKAATSIEATALDKLKKSMTVPMTEDRLIDSFIADTFMITADSSQANANLK
jgi:hypothetical protein